MLLSLVLAFLAGGRLDSGLDLGGGRGFAAGRALGFVAGLGWAARVVRGDAGIGILLSRERFATRRVSTIILWEALLDFRAPSMALTAARWVLAARSEGLKA